MQKIFYFNRINKKLDPITEEEYEMMIGYMSLNDMETDESEHWSNHFNINKPRHEQ